MSTPNSAPDPTNSAPELLTLRGVAKALGIDAGQLSKESSRPGFPRRQVGEDIFYDADEVLRWRQSNVRRKKDPRRPSPTIPAEPRVVDRPSPAPAMPPGLHRASPPAASPDPPPPAAPQLDLDVDADFLRVLLSGTGTPIEISRATVQIAARRVARAHLIDRLGPNDLDGLKKALQELRTAEAGYIELEQSRRGLIPRDEVKQIIGDCCSRLVRVLSILENSIAMELSIWLADPKTAEMPAEDRARLVRGYVAKVTREARTAEADDVERLINKPQTE